MKKPEQGMVHMPETSRGLATLRDSQSGSIEIYDWHVVKSQLEATLEMLNLQSPRNLETALRQLDEIMVVLPGDMGAAREAASLPEASKATLLFSKVFGIFSEGLRQVRRNAEKRATGTERFELLKTVATQVAELRKKIDFEINNAAETQALAAKDNTTYEQSQELRTQIETAETNLRRINKAMTDPSLKVNELEIGRWFSIIYDDVH